MTEGQLRYQRYKKTYQAYRRKNREKVNDLTKKWQIKNQDKVKKTDEKYKSENKDRVRARMALDGAVRYGKLIRGECEVCGTDKDIDGHHYLGYDKEHWLDVKWLCMKHHYKVHIKN